MKPREATVLTEWTRECCRCRAQASMQETVPHAGGVAFYLYCGGCWHAPAANGGPSAAERTGVNAPGYDPTTGDTP